MSHTWIKICGLTRPRDVEDALEAGVDALGFVFAPLSNRLLDTAHARELVAGVPVSVARVALFQDQGVQEVARILDAVPVDLLQFHGSEPAHYCVQFGKPYIKAVSMAQAGSMARAEMEHSNAAGLLLDSHEPGRPGGSGVTFDWSAITDCRLPVIVAGGLNPLNVFEAVTRIHPWGVDVSSGVESTPGTKAVSLVKKFVEEVKRADRSIAE